MNFFAVQTIVALLLSRHALSSPIDNKTSESHPYSRPPHLLADTPGKAIDDIENSLYKSDNWAGVVLSGSGYTSVTAEFLVPEPKVPSGAQDGVQYCGCAWVGLDGTGSCPSAILQTGVNWCVGTDGGVTYTPWYEWFPAPQSSFSMSISSGDSIRATVSAYSLTTGIAIIENLSNGEQFVMQYIGDEEASFPICEANAEWILEDFTLGSGGLVPFADFEGFQFTGAYASHNGQAVGANGGTLYALTGGSNGGALPEIDGDTTINIIYSP